MNRIKELRKNKGMNQDALADFMGVSQQTISKIEKDIESISIDLLIALASFFNVTTDYILGISNEKRNLFRAECINKKIESYYDYIIEFENLDEHSQKILLAILHVLKNMES